MTTLTNSRPPAGYARRVLLGLMQLAAALWFCFWMLMAFVSYGFRDFAPEAGSRLSVPKALLLSSVMVGLGCLGPFINHRVRRGVNKRHCPLKDEARGFEVLPPR